MRESQLIKSPEQIKYSEREGSSPRAEVISGEELFNMIYKGGVLPKDRRFLDKERGGIFKYFSIEQLLRRRENMFYSIVKVGDKIVGLCELEKSPYRENLYWIKFISIDPKYQGNRYASKLMEEVFRFAKEKKMALEASSYSSEGLVKIKPLCRRLAAEFEVEFTEQVT